MDSSKFAKFDDASFGLWVGGEHVGERAAAEGLDDEHVVHSRVWLFEWDLS